MDNFAMSSSLSDLNDDGGRRKPPPSVLLQRRIWTLVKVLLFLGILVFVIVNRLSIKHIMNASRPVPSSRVSNSSGFVDTAGWVQDEETQQSLNETRRTIDALAAHVLHLQQRLDNLSAGAGEVQEQLQRYNTGNQNTADSLATRVDQLGHRMDNISADASQMQEELLERRRNESQTTTGGHTLPMAQLDQRLNNISAVAGQMREELQQYRAESQTTAGDLTVQVAHLDQQLETLSDGSDHLKEQVLQECTSQIQTATDTLTTQMDQMDQQLNLLKTNTTQTDPVLSGCSRDDGTKVLNGTRGSIAVLDEAYRDSMDCVWNIEAPSDTILVLSWKRFHLEADGDCSYDYVSVQETTGRQLYGDKLCGNSEHLTTNPDWVVMTNQLQVTFHSDSSTTHGGFQLDYQALTIP